MKIPYLLFDTKFEYIKMAVLNQRTEKVIGHGLDNRDSIPKSNRNFYLSDQSGSALDMLRLLSTGYQGFYS
jgi:hypothetical protein